MPTNREPAKPPPPPPGVEDLLFSLGGGGASGTATPPSPARQWTDEQRRGITTVGHSLLVSAAAGSGKTSVLAERCAHLVCDAEEPHRCDVDELLVVTFTEAAAAEMRSRISSALRARAAAAAPTDRLLQQLALMEHANISTLHAFCSRVLRQHFHTVGLDPTFSVLDAEEAKLLRGDVARKLMEDRFELDDAGDFQRLVDAYGDGDDGRIARLVIDTHEMLCSLRDPDEWVGRALSRIERAATLPLDECELGRELIAFITRWLEDLRARCAEVIRQVARTGSFPKYLEQLHDHAATLVEWQKVLAEEGLDALAAEVKDVELPRLPSVKNDVPGKDAAKAAIDSIRNAIKTGPWRDCLAFTSAEWRDGMRAVLPHARLLLALVQQFGQHYRMAKDAARTVDFSDLERFTLQALRDNSRDGVHPTPAARVYQRRFKHVLVDEYQDINEVQDAILALLSRDAVPDGASADSGVLLCDTGVPPVLDASGYDESEFADAPATSHGRDARVTAHRHRAAVPGNLFCVGDVKQSIYRFRLAEPTRFLQRQAMFRGDAPPFRLGEVIDLQSNFRSRSPLLAAVNAVFERLMTAEAADIDYDESHRLRPGLEFPEPGEGVCCFEGAPIELHLLPAKVGAAPAAGGEDEETGDGTSGGGGGGGASNSAAELERNEREAVFVARRVRELLGLGEAPPMCVMERGADGQMSPRPVRQGDVVILLRSMRYKADQYASALRAAGIGVHSESGTGYFDAMEIRDMLALLSLLNNQRQDIPLAAVLRSPLGELPEPEDGLARVRLAYREGGVPFHEAVRRYAAEHDDELAAKLRDFLANLAHWRQLAQRRPLAELVWTVYQDTGYLAYCGGLHGGEQRVANLMHLHERATQFGSFHRQDLGRFLQFLESLRAEADLGQPSIASEAEDVVRIMSVHASKGLEFPVVFLPDLGKAINMQDCQGAVLVDRSAGLGMAVVNDHLQVRYPSLASVLVQNRLRQQALAEELRVLYVAMTRAKEHLVLLGTCDAAVSADRWAGRWADHKGPLPPDAVLGARCMLDWVGPVAVATGGNVGETFRITTYSAEDVAAWDTPGKRYERRTPEQERMARLEPFDAPGPPDPVAEQVIARMTGAYPFEPFTGLAAAHAITEEKAFAGGDGRPDQNSGRETPPARAGQESRPRPAPIARSLAAPKFLASAGDRRAPAEEIGTVTHLVLEHLDFRRPCDEPDLKRQLDELVARGLLADAQAKWVDLPSIEWLCGSELGRLLRREDARLRREVPIYLAAPPERFDDAPPSGDPLDQVMIRGRLDALLALPGGAVLIDYKTDQIAADEVPARAAVYGPQLGRYAEAVEKITGTPVAAAWLVFLTPRVLVDANGGTALLL